MSKISLEPNASGAGTFSIVSPDSNTNRTLNLPDASGMVATIENIPPGYEDQDALDLFNVSGSAPVYACRAWVNFNGTNGNIRASGNVSSVTRNGTGAYTVNFTTAMPDANYTVCGLASNTDSGVNSQALQVSETVTPTTSSVKVTNNNATGGKADRVFMNVAIFR